MIIPGNACKQTDLLPGGAHALTGQEHGTACGQSGGAYIWHEALIAMMDAGEWPAPQEPKISWSCHQCHYTWQGGFADITDCCGKSVKEVVLHHIDEIVGKLCETPGLEIQGQLPIPISIREATEIILSPHGRSYQGLVSESWDLSTVFHAAPSCSCVYDKTIITTDIRQFDPMTEQTDTEATDQSWETVPGAAAKGVEQDGGEVTTMMDCSPTYMTMEDLY